MKYLYLALAIVGICFTTGCRTVYYPVARHRDQASCTYYNIDDIKNFMDNTHDFKTYDEYMSVNYGF